jgi:hypothetical protein
MTAQNLHSQRVNWEVKKQSILVLIYQRLTRWRNGLDEDARRNR